MILTPARSACFLFALAIPAQAQTIAPDTSAFQSSLLEVLSFASFGTISVRQQSATVTQNGSRYHIRLPLSGYTDPPDAALTALGRPADAGMVDIESMAFPSAGTIETPAANGAANRVTYSLGKQAITARIDPALAQPSTYSATFGRLRFSSDRGGQHSEQTIGNYVTDGTLSADPGGLMTFASQGHGTDFHLTGHGVNGLGTDFHVASLAGHFGIDGFDRAQGLRLMSALRGYTAAMSQPSADQPAALSAPRRQALLAMIDAAQGLASRADAEETLEDIRYDIATKTGNSTGTIGRARFNMAGNSDNGRIDTHLVAVLDGISPTSITAEADGFAPHHVELKTVFAGMRIGPLMTLLRAAVEDGPDVAARQAEVIALLSDPRTRMEIETLSFDLGPAAIIGSMKTVPGPDGRIGARIRIAATGVDALLARMQGNPKAQNMLPMIFMAKGMGRQQGDSLVWDISVGNGPTTVNGVPFGQPPAKTR